MMSDTGTGKRRDGTDSVHAPCLGAEVFFFFFPSAEPATVSPKTLQPNYGTFIFFPDEKGLRDNEELAEQK